MVKNFYLSCILFVIILLLYFGLKGGQGSWDFFKTYWIFVCLLCFILVKVFHYWMKNTPKKFDEIVGFGSIAATEIVLGNILFVYPSYLTLFYFSKAIGSVVIGVGADSLKRKTVLYVTLIVFAIFSLTSFVPEWFESVIPLSLSLVMIGLLGDPSIVARAVLLDAHIHEISGNRLKCKLLMARSVRVETFAWIFISVISYTFHAPMQYFLLFGVGLSVALAALSRFVIDKTHPDKSHAGIRGMVKECIAISFLGTVFLSFLFYNWVIETSFFSFFFNVEKTFDELCEKSVSAMNWSIGMYIGCWLHEKGLRHVRERTSFLIGLALSIFGFLIYMAANQIELFSLKNNLHLASFAVVGLGSGVFLPCFYSIATSFGRIHSFGILIGMVDLIRTLGEWIGSILAEKEQFFCCSMCCACAAFFLLAIFLLNRVLKKREASHKEGN